MGDSLRRVSALDSSYLKIKRANEHIKDLHVQMHAFFDDPGVYRIVRKFNHGSSEQFVYCVLRKPMPDMWPVMVGEICFNFLSALDHMMVALAVKHTEVKEWKIYFPILENPERFREAMTQRKKYPGFSTEKLPISAIIGAKAYRKIVRIQPYRPDIDNGGGNMALWQLKTLRNHDGHNFLVPSTTISNRINYRIDGEVFVRTTIGKPRRYDNGVHIGSARGMGVRFDRFGQPKPKIEILSAGKIGIGDIAGLEGRYLIPTLQGFSRECWRIFREVHEVFV